MAERDIWTSLERARASFVKGLASLQLMVERNAAEIVETKRAAEKVADAERAVSERVTTLEARLPGNLVERLVIAEAAIEELQDTKKEVTGRIDSLRMKDARGDGEVERAKVKVEDRKARFGIVVAIIAAVGSLAIQLLKMIGGE